MDDVLEFLKAAKTYYLATVDEEGNPRVRPFGTIAKFEGRLYIQTGKKKAASRQMHAHPAHRDLRRRQGRHVAAPCRRRRGGRPR